ncbi:MAG: hypothetical protein IIB90_08685 [Gemmatimonadetes bacterium]|nr:hypothetical protein [Gemmatimonadota bacterium]
MSKQRLSWSLLAIALYATPAAARQVPTQQDSILIQLRQLLRRVDSLEHLVANLRAAGADTTGPIDELAALRAAARAAAGTGTSGAETTTSQVSRTGNLQVLNPEISVTGDVVGSYIAPGGASNNASWTPREFEFSFQAALDPYTRTKIFVTREEDFEIAGFPEEEGAEEEGGSFEIEEGYMYWVGLPGGFGAKIGKFRQEIGLYNRWHTHALFEIDRPLAATTFLGEDGLIQTGLGVTLPNVTLGPSTIIATLEATRGDNDVLFEGGNEISYLGRLQSFFDMGASYIQIGATGVLGENDDAGVDTELLGIDASFRWTPPGRAQYRDFQLKAEWYFAEKTTPTETLTGNGGYLQANLRMSRRWILGARTDYVNGFGVSPDILQFVPSISWWQSEWVRLRVQYNYVRPNGGPNNHTLLLQAMWAMGPHKHESY